MLAVAFDTHDFVKRLRDTGIPEAQAEAHVSVLKEVQQANASELATKADFNVLKSEMKTDMQALKSELRMEMADIRAEMKVLKWMQGVSLAGIAGLMTMMLKLVMHQ